MLLPSVRTLISLRVCGKFRWLTAVVRVVSSALLIFWRILRAFAGFRSGLDVVACAWRCRFLLSVGADNYVWSTRIFCKVVRHLQWCIGSCCYFAWWLFVVFCHGYIFPIKPFAVCFVDALVMVWAYLAFGVHSDYLIRRSASFVAACFSISYCAALLFCSCQFSISERLKKSEPFCL